MMPPCSSRTGNLVTSTCRISGRAVRGMPPVDETLPALDHDAVGGDLSEVAAGNRSKGVRPTMSSGRMANIWA